MKVGDAQAVEWGILSLFSCYNDYMTTTKLYAYVDETGQDTAGAFFLVVVVLKEINDLE